MIIILLSLVLSITTGSMHNHSMHHSSHRHMNPLLPTCRCITGFDTSVMSCTDQAAIDGIECYLTQNNCETKCGKNVTDPTFDLKCQQYFSAFIQFHDWCETLTVNETLFHSLLNTCGTDCLQEFQTIPNAPECSHMIQCDNTTYINNIIDTAVAYCDPATCMVKAGMTSNINCTMQYRMVEGIHRMCSHKDITTNFDTKFDELVNKWTNCSFACNVPNTINATCKEDKNTIYTNLTAYAPLTIAKIKECSKGTQSTSSGQSTSTGQTSTQPGSTNDVTHYKVIVSLFALVLSVLYV